MKNLNGWFLFLCYKKVLCVREVSDRFFFILVCFNYNSNNNEVMSFLF